MEYWNVGFEKRKTAYSLTNVNAIFLNDARQTSIFCKIPQNNKKTNTLSCSRFLSFKNPSFHYSSIPTFQFGGAPSLFEIRNNNSLSVNVLGRSR